MYEIKILPKRESFFGKGVEKLRTCIAEKKCFPFLPHSFDGVGGSLGEYILRGFGVGPGGARITVDLRDIPIYFDVQIPAGEKIADIEQRAKAAVLSFQGGNCYSCREDGQTCKRHEKYPIAEPRMMFPLRGFRKEPVQYVRLYFSSAVERSRVLDEFIDYETSSDDRQYIKLAIRIANIHTADWNIVSLYAVNSTLPHYDFSFSVSASIVTKYIADDQSKIVHFGDDLQSGRTMLCVWDIETYSKNTSLSLEKEEVDDYVIFVIGAAFYWQYEETPILTVAICLGECNDLPGVHFLQRTRTEKDLIHAWIELLQSMRPDIYSAFNGSCFDCPRVIEKIEKYNCTAKFISAISAEESSKVKKDFSLWNLASPKVKIDPTLKHHTKAVVKLPGILDTDAMIAMRKIYPKEEVTWKGSLKFYLSKNNLAGKDDITLEYLRSGYETGKSRRLCRLRKCHCGIFPVRPVCAGSFNHDRVCCFCNTAGASSRMEKVVKYCVRDCTAIQDLFLKKAIIGDARELSTLSRCTMYDSFYNADGGRVVNLLALYGEKWGVAVTTIVRSNKADDKSYPGGMVFQPQCKLYRDPIGILDFNSLYPSLERVYNLSPEKIVTDPAEKESLEKEGYSLHQIGPFSLVSKKNNKGAGEECIAWSVRHNSPSRPATPENKNKIVSEYRTIVRVGENQPIDEKYSVSEEPDEEFLNTILSKRERKTEYQPIYGRNRLPGESPGLFPRVLEKLFEKRKAARAKIAELLSSANQSAKTETLVSQLESKQKALKILANTFYGQTGSKYSSAKDIYVAAGTTTAGQAEISFVAEVCRSFGFDIVYGDTDSLFLLPPASIVGSVVSENNKSTENSRLHLWTELVLRSSIVMKNLTDALSAILARRNNTLLLNMAFEGVALPMMLCGKKKYFGRIHAGKIPSFRGPIMIKGIDSAKKGKLPIVKKFAEDYMAEVIDIDYCDDPTITCLKYIEQIVSKEPNVQNFAKTSSYREGKGGCNSQFIARMKEAHDKATREGNFELAQIVQPPENGDQFSYVVVQTQKYTIRGTNVKCNKSDKMEFVKTYLHSKLGPSPMKISIVDYIGSDIAAIFARFILYEKMFDRAAVGKVDHENIDTARMEEAKKYLIAYAESIAGGGSSRGAKQGLIDTYRAGVTSLKKHIAGKYTWGKEFNKLFMHGDPLRLINAENEKACKMVIQPSIQSTEAELKVLRDVLRTDCEKEGVFVSAFYKRIITEFESRIKFSGSSAAEYVPNITAEEEKRCRNFFLLVSDFAEIEKNYIGCVYHSRRQRSENGGTKD